MYEDIVIHISGPNRGSGYQVRAETRFGEGKGTLELPLSAEEISHVLEGFSDFLRGPQTTRHVRTANGGTRSSLDPRQFGKQLFRGIFSEEIGQLYGSCWAMAIQQGAKNGASGVRIQLKLDPLPELYSLPWELLYDPGDENFLVLSRKSPIVRYLNVRQSPVQVSLTPPIHVLVAMANPPGSDPLKLEQEREMIEKALQVDGVNLHVLEHTTPRSLHKALLKQAPQVLHYMGHGDILDGEGVLYLESDWEDQEPITGNQLAMLLRDYNVQMIFLNACRTAQTAQPTVSFRPFAGVATALVQAGAPAVIAMQCEISDQGAIDFCEAFYGQLAWGEPIEAAVAVGRQRLSLGRSHPMEWAIPVLFLRSPSSRFEGTKPEPPPPQPARAEILHQYLLRVIEQNQSLDLPGLPQGGRRDRLPLEAVYAFLRSDTATLYERAQSHTALVEQARRLEDLAGVDDLTPEQRFRVLWRQVSLVAQDPLPASLEERDRPQLFHRSSASTVDLAEAFRRERRLVILGDPGSGKTTLARWLALRLAQACLQGKDRVWVPAWQVDPAAEAERMVDIGPARLPFLVRTAAFAKARQDDPSLTLEAFLARHLAELVSAAPADRTTCDSVLRELLRESRVVLLVDGLDEVSDPSDRYEIVRVLDRFLDTWLPQTFPAIDPQAMSLTAPPFEAGGNQAVITSRIIGYQMSPLGRAAAHLTIEPMTEQVAERFCDLWVRSVHRAHLGPGQVWDARRESEASRECEGLKGAITGLRQRGAGELASHPLLITILALVFRHGQMSFPRQRSKLYDVTVRILIQQWRERARVRGGRLFGEAEIRDLLIQLAAGVHQSSAIGILDEVQLKAMLGERLSASDLDAFLVVVREEVGLLTARGEGIYGFLHLTFQEYLAGCALVRDRAEAPERILEKLTAPRWREPLLMALGQLSRELDEAGFTSLLLDLLQRPGALDPRAALLLIAAVPEMETVPAGAIEKAAELLLAIYAQRSLLRRFPSLGEQIENAFRNLARGPLFKVVDRVLQRSLRTPPAESPDQRLAAAHLVCASNRFTAGLAEALTQALDHDGVLWSWPIDRALRAIAAQAPELLPSPPSSLRRILQQEPELAGKFLSLYDWMRVGVMLYGGIDEPFLVRVAEAQARCDRLRRELQSQTAAGEKPETADAIRRLREELTTAQDALGRARSSGFWFSPERMHRDSPGVTPLVITALRQPEPIKLLIPALWEQWHRSRHPAVRRDTLLALVALDGSIELATGPDGVPPTDVVAQLSRVTQTLRDSIPNTLGPTLAALGQLAGSCPWQHWIDLVAAILDVAITLGHRPEDVIALESAAPEPAKPYLLAEVWNYHFSSSADDPRYEAAVLLDHYGSTMATPPIKLARTLAVASASLNSRRGSGAGWSLDPLSGRPVQSVDVVTAALDAIAAIPFDFVQHWALQCLSPLFEPTGLRLEALILAVGIPGWGSYQSDTLKALTRPDENLLGLQEEIYPAAILIGWARSLTDPYHRFRCYWRLLQSFSDLRTQESAAAIALAAEAVTDPVRRAWAFEQLATFGDLIHPRERLARARDAARKIVAPDHRARSLARLALRFPLEASTSSLLEQSLRDAALIKDPRERAETLLSLRSCLAGQKRLLAQLDLLLESFGDDIWNRAKARGTSALPLQVYGPQLAQAGGDMGMILLGALVNDLRRRLALPNDIAGLWSALLTENRSAAHQALAHHARVHGLRLTSEAMAALDRLLEKDGPAAIHPFLQLVQNPHPSVVPFLETWLAHPDPVLQRHAHLLLAEAKGLSARGLPDLVALLEGTDDRARHRAALVLHGNWSHPRNLIHSAALGTETLIRLARLYLDSASRKPQIAQVLGWTFERIEHNDGRAISAWAETVERGGPQAEEALLLLGAIRRLHAHAWTAFREQLAHGIPAVRGALSLSICTILAGGEMSDERWQEILPAVQRAQDARLDQEEFVLDQEVTLAEAAAEACHGEDGASRSLEARVALAEKIYAARRRTVGAALRQEPASSLRLLLTAIGKERLADHYYEGARRAAETIEQAPQAFEILIDWLAAALQQDVHDRGRFHLLRSSLLGVVAAATERLPSTFLNRAQKLPGFEQRLREAVVLHKTFTGRQAALTLLSYLRCVTPHSLAALRAGLRDTAPVQKIVLQSVLRYRRIEEHLLPQLFEDLLDPSPAVGYATLELLAAIARNIHLSPHVRQQIVEALAQAMDDGRSQRDVYLFVPQTPADHDTSYRILHQGRLDQLIYGVLAQLNGTAGLGGQP